MGLYRRGSRWYYRFEWQGREIRKGGHRTWRAARDAEAARRTELGAMPPGVSGAPTFPVAAAQYLTEVVAAHANPRGERALFRTLETRWAGRTVDSLSLADVDAFRRWRAVQSVRTVQNGQHGRPVTGATVNRDLAALSAFFGWCQERGYLPVGRNPARARGGRQRGLGVPRFPEPWRPWQTLARSQQGRFLAAFAPMERRRVELLLETGARLGVLLRVRWPQVDLERRLLAYTSKTRSVVIPLSPRAVALFRACRPRPAGPVFPTSSDTAIRRAWPAACRAAGLDASFRRHDLRVTRARRAADAGADLKTIAALLGQATITMAARYIPADLQAQRAVVAAVCRHRNRHRRPGRSRS